MQDIFVKVAENTIGPLSPRKIESLIRQGVFSPSDLVWSNADGDWVPAGDLSDLRRFFDLSQKKKLNTDPSSRVIAVASGKGGAGKTVFAASLGVGLASLGHKVTMVDADFGGANLHTAMGILQPEFNFDDFFSAARKPLSDFVVKTPVDGLTLIGGSCGSIATTTLNYAQKRRFIRALRKLTADYVILDLGGGSQFNVIDLFLLADDPIIITVPEMPSIQEAFSFLKMTLLRRLTRVFKFEEKILDLIHNEEVNKPGRISKTMEELYLDIRDIDLNIAIQFRSTLNSFRPRLVLNKKINRSDEDEAFAIQTAAFELLSVEVEYLGAISFDENVEEAVQNFKPFLLHAPKSCATKDAKKLIRKGILKMGGLERTIKMRKWKEELEIMTAGYPGVPISEEVPIFDIVNAKLKKKKARESAREASAIFLI